MDSPGIDISQMSLPPSVVTGEEPEEHGDTTMDDLTINLDSESSQSTVIEEELGTHGLDESMLAQERETLSKSVEPIVIQPSGNFPISSVSSEAEYSFTELQDIKVSEDSNLSALDMLEGLENVDSFAEEGLSVYESSASSNFGIGDMLSASVKSEQDSPTKDSDVVDLTFQEKPASTEQEGPRVILKDCSHMLSEKGTATVDEPSTSKDEQGDDVIMVTKKESPKQDFLYNYKKFVALSEEGKNMLFKAIQETRSVVKVAREYSRKFGFLLTEENVRENAVSFEGTRAVSRHKDVSVDDHHCASLTPAEKARVGKFASRHGTGAAAQWAYDALGKVVSRTTVNNCTITKQKRPPMIDPKIYLDSKAKGSASSFAAARISVQAQRRYKNIQVSKPSLAEKPVSEEGPSSKPTPSSGEKPVIGPTQKKYRSLVSKRTLFQTIQKDSSFTFFIQNCGFSWQEQRHILASAVHNGVVPTARFFTTKNNRLLSELLVRKLAARAGKGVESKAADIIQLSETSKEQIVQFFTKMRKYDRSALKIIATADEFSKRTGLPLSEDMIAKIIWPEGRGQKEPLPSPEKTQ